MADEEPLSPSEAVPTQPVIVKVPPPEATPAEAVILTPSQSPAQSPSQVTLTASLAASFSIPLPPPEVLKQYSEFIPNVGERFLKMVEQEAKHRQAQEQLRLQAEIEDQRAQRRETRFGQMCALIIGFIAIGGGVVASVLGAPIPGGIIGFAGVIGLVTAFLRKRSIDDGRKPDRTGQKGADGAAPMSEPNSRS